MREIDLIVDFILALAALFIIGFPMYYFSSLPEEIPIHFNAKGEIDQYGGKNLLWVLSSVALIMLAGLRLVRDQKNNYNYPVKITDKNEEVQYRLARYLLQFIAVLTALMFSGLIYTIVGMSLGFMAKGIPWILPLFILVLIIGLIIYMRQVYKANRITK